MVNNSTNINKTNNNVSPKKSLNSDGQQDERLLFVLLIFVELLTITVKTSLGERLLFVLLIFVELLAFTV
jgi:hypothetical protein